MADPLLSLEFTYHGSRRVVDNCSFRQHSKRAVVVGLEVLKDDEPTRLVKRYALEDMERVEKLDPDATRELRRRYGMGERPRDVE